LLEDEAVFKEEAKLMALFPFVLIVLGLLAALVVPSYIGRARKAACYQQGGAWGDRGCELPETRTPPTGN